MVISSRPGLRSPATLQRWRRRGQHRPDLYLADPRHSWTSIRPGPCVIMVGVPWAQHVAFLDDRLALRQTSAAMSFAGTFTEVPSECRRSSLLAMRSLPRSCDGREELVSSGFSETSTAEAKSAARQTVCSHTSTTRQRNTSICRFSMWRRSTCISTARRICAHIWRAFRMLAGDKPLLLAEAGVDSIREGLRGSGSHYIDATAHRVRRGSVRSQSRSHGPTSGGGAVTLSLTGPSGLWTHNVVPSQLCGRWPTYSQRYRSRLRRVNAGPKCLSWSVRITRQTPLENVSPRSRHSHIPTLTSSSSMTAREITTGAISRRFPFATVIDIPNGGLSAARNVGLASGDRRDCRIHRLGRSC